MSEPFLIYNASAGAGKTYQLVRNYLKLCLQGKDPMRFMQILAITFTNKAAREMKNRLLAQLRLLETYPELEGSERLYAEELATEMGLEVLDLKHRASRSLSAILHHYAAFSVSTIDSFTNRLIRSFSKDLNLNGSFQIELDNERMLEEAIDRLLDNLQEGDPFTEVLSRFISRQIEDERSSDIRRLLKDRGKELFSERAFPFLDQLKQLDAPKTLELEEALRKRHKSLREELKAMAQAFLDTAKELELRPEHFNRGIFYVWVRNIATGNYPVSTKSQEALFESQDIGKIPSPKAKKEGLLSDTETQLLFYNKALAIKLFYEGNIEELFILELILDNIHALALLGQIEIHIDEIKQESGRLPIGDFNKIIARELAMQPAAFLYERLGERFQDFFIDEFQDTSKLQWSNLLPLINNALAGADSSTMIVGDAKQSIYRFRGGDLQLFVDLFKGVEASNKIAGRELYQRKVINMGANYRSRPGVVDFNNRLFARISADLPDEDYRNIYAQGEQEPAREGKAYLSLNLLGPDPKKEDYHQAALERIQDLLSRGFRQRDICLLVRVNSKGKEAAQYLLEHEELLNLPAGERLQILSSDSLEIGASPKVKALISFLEMSERPHQKENRREWMAYLKEEVAADDLSELRNHLAQSSGPELALALESIIPDFNYQAWQEADLVEKCYLLMRGLNMNWQSDPFLQFFLDQVREYQSKNRPVVAEFLEWWLDRGSGRSVSIPEQTNALHIMSVHKSKGLEFPVVIYLFAEGALDQMAGAGRDKTAWVALKTEQFLLPFSFIKFKKAPLPEKQPLYQSWYQKELSRTMMDELNVYYVAFTRAERELHILSQPKPKKGSSNAYMQQYLALEFEADGHGIYTLGAPEMALSKTASHPQYKVRPYKPLPWREKLHSVAKLPKNWQGDHLKEARFGSQVHQLLAHLKSKKDLDKVLRRAQEEAWIASDELQSLENHLNLLLEKEEMTPLFHSEAKVYNERSLLIPGQGQKIPDRLVCFEGQWFLADYKTGQKEAQHIKQVAEYRQLLLEAGIPISKAYLLYLNEEAEIIAL